jgi:hypothetical protein
VARSAAGSGSGSSPAWASAASTTRRTVFAGDVLADVVRDDVEAVPGDAAAQADAGARLQLLGQPRLVEPGGTDVARRIRDVRREDQQAATAPARNRAHHARDDRLLVAEQVADAPLRCCHLVAVRARLQGVAHRAQAELRQAGAQAAADARQHVEAGVETLRPGEAAWPWPGRRGDGLGEGDREDATGGGRHGRPSIGPAAGPTAPAAAAAHCAASR